MLPSEAEMLERDIHVERKRRSEARKERFVEEPVRLNPLTCLPVTPIVREGWVQPQQQASCIDRRPVSVITEPAGFPP